ncbi:DUF2868 domain-containing protein [Marinobacter halophilus]|uniref:DUF2868 domain-containing protein n=1 Tax=Marinobacter halophilus TaxID=1323740 RepID=A0A2T1KK19_9GAMM|nr:DUF2868 domain-containing protein [Marinobacter halophilus]PSF10043.1 DUF2868 domain-containing protein [Marinobacter halophilus]GGC67243.1 hypothetical protein GCM10011362_14680 [Marinobacter halophilus]
MSHNPLRLLLDFDDRIQRDRDQAPAFLHRRDRRFALDCQEQGANPDAAGWLQHMDRLSGPGGTRQTGRYIQRRWRRITGGFALAGAMLGSLTMAGLLFYDGGQRINITVLLGFVLLQLLLALATTVQSIVGWQPWTWLQRWLERRLQLQSPGPTLAQLQPVLMARAAHTGGSLFALTGLMTLLVMLVVQDLAFGWSTTLDTAAQGYHGLIRAIAIPWTWLWPAAVPSQELIEATRFFRAAPFGAGTAPQQWGQWWPFVSMLWLTWVLLPRLVLLAFSQWLIGYKATRLLQRHPGRKALLYRMETPTLDTGNQHNDAGDLPDTHTRASPGELTDAGHIICWAGAGEPELPLQLLATETRVFKAGGRIALSEDDQLVATLAKALAGAASPVVTLVTRSWEPPTGELHDFLEQARSQWPRNSRVMILPLATDANQPPAIHLIQPWLRFTERLPEGFATVVLLPSFIDNPYQTGTPQP